MRLRAQYLFETGKTEKISFIGTDHTYFSFQNWLRGERYLLTGRRISVKQTGIMMKPDTKELHRFLEIVYSYCGTSSLDRQLTAVRNYELLQAGDVLIQPGCPGHAMIIADVCINDAGQKAFLLLQGYMPAQDIHLVKNPGNEGISPWYILDSLRIITPEWKFTRGQLKSWN